MKEIPTIVLNTSETNKHKQRVLLIEHTTKEFVISRLPLAIFLKNKGFEVFALLPVGGEASYYEQIKRAGIQVITYPYKRNNTSVFTTIGKVFLFKNIFQQYQFELIHSFKFQPNFYASLAKLFVKKSNLILHITGLGIVFTKKKSLKLKALKLLSQLIFAFNFFVANQLIFQNKEDPQELWFSSFFKNKCALIEGSGVDVQKFNKAKYDVAGIKKELQLTDNQIVITFISRLIWQKGVREIVEAVAILAQKNPNLHALIIGGIDAKNPDAVSSAFISKYATSNNITFLGNRNDIAELLAISDIYVYPSYYREGVPRTVMEAMATGLPIITTQMPGCNICVEEGENGFLIAPKSTESVVGALTKMLTSSDLEQMSLTSRMLALKRFQNKIIYEENYKLYLQLITQTI